MAMRTFKYPGNQCVSSFMVIVFFLCQDNVVVFNQVAEVAMLI